jgi:hypothetical protein
MVCLIDKKSGRVEMTRQRQQNSLFHCDKSATARTRESRYHISRIFIPFGDVNPALVPAVPQMAGHPL